MKILRESKIFQSIPTNVIHEILNEEKTYNRENVLSKTEWGEALRIFLLLTHRPDEVSKIAELSPDDKEQIIYLSRYYWLKKFSILWQKIHGEDPGLQQFLFKSIEDYSNIQGFDWDHLKSIDNELKEFK